LFSFKTPSAVRGQIKSERNPWTIAKMKTTIFVSIFSLLAFFIFVAGSDASPKKQPTAKFPAGSKKSVFVEQGKNGRLSYRHLDTYPEDGQPFVKMYPPHSITVDEADREAIAQHNDSIIYTVGNNATIPMCLFGRTTNLKTGEALEPGVNAPHLYLQPNSTLQFGNTVPLRKGENHNGILLAKWGCDKSCQKCAGLAAAVDTLAEWTYDTEGSFWSDISLGEYFLCHRVYKANEGLVDGLSTNVNITVMNSTSTCHPRRWCQVSKAQLKEHCPKENSWYHKESWGCQSDCKRWGKKEFCDDPSRASSAFLKDLCPQAYSWAYDDQERYVVNGCIEGIRSMKVVFGQIK
jgi:hypothetical protein